MQTLSQKENAVLYKRTVLSVQAIPINDVQKAGKVHDDRDELIEVRYGTIELY